MARGTCTVTAVNWGSVASTLIAVLVGATVSQLGNWLLSHRQARERTAEALRAETLTTVSEYLGAIERLRQATGDVENWSRNWRLASSEAGHTDAAAESWEHHGVALAEQREARISASSALSRIALLAPVLSQPAGRLTSLPNTMRDTDRAQRDEDRWEVDYAAFVDAARAHLGMDAARRS